MRADTNDGSPKRSESITAPIMTTKLDPNRFTNDLPIHRNAAHPPGPFAFPPQQWPGECLSPNERHPCTRFQSEWRCRGVGLATVLAACLTLPATAGEVAVTVTPAFASEYMFRGVRLGGSSFQPCVEVAVGNFTGSLWVSTPLAERVPGQSDPEFDPSLSYSFEITDKLSLEPGITAYFYPNADTADGFFQATYEPFLAANWTVAGFELTPKFYYDVVLQGPTFELNAAYSVPLEKLSTQLDFSATLGTYWMDEAIKDAAPRVENCGSYFQIGVALPFKLGEQATMTTGLAYAVGFENYYTSAGSPRTENSAAVGRVVATVSLAFTF